MGNGVNFGTLGQYETGAYCKTQGIQKTNETAIVLGTPIRVDKFEDIDTDGNGSLDCVEYTDGYIRQREVATGEVLREGDPRLAHYRTEAGNLYDALSEVREDGKTGITKERANAFKRVMMKDGLSLSQQRIAIVKKEGPRADVFNGKTLGTMVDEIQYGKDKQNRKPSNFIANSPMLNFNPKLLKFMGVANKSNKQENLEKISKKIDVDY